MLFLNSLQLTVALGKSKAYNTFKDNIASSHKSKEGNDVPYERKNTVDEESNHSEPVQRVPYFTWGKLWLYAGPGWLMSIAYLDPGNSKF